MSTDLSMSRSFHTAEEWESQRQTFQRLYVTEDKPLGKVVGEMYKIHGFQATYVTTFRKSTKLFFLLKFQMSLCSTRLSYLNLSYYTITGQCYDQVHLACNPSNI